MGFGIQYHLWEPVTNCVHHHPSSRETFLFVQFLEGGTSEILPPRVLRPAPTPIHDAIAISTKYPSSFYIVRPQNPKPSSSGRPEIVYKYTSPLPTAGRPPSNADRWSPSPAARESPSRR